VNVPLKSDKSFDIFIAGFDGAGTVRFLFIAIGYLEQYTG